MINLNYDIIHIQAIKDHSTGHFFDPGYNRLFNTRYPQYGYRHDGKAYFITSERFGHFAPRLYSICVLDWETGKVDTVGEFQEYGTKGRAETALRRLLS